MKKNKKKIGISVDFIDSFKKIKKVQDSIPNFDFKCKDCKNNCCISPYISIAEFVYVVRYIVKNFEKPNELLFNDNGRNCDGILICPFLSKNKMCSIYPVRHYKCRMTGMDVVDEFFVNVCENRDKLDSRPIISKQDWYSWVDYLTKANKNFQYEDQKTFQAWIKFYFEDKEKLNDHELRVQELIKNYLTIDNYIPFIKTNEFFE